MKITSDTKQAISIVYGMIGYDLPSDTDNEEAIECCIDASRLQTNGFPEAHTEVMTLISEHGYVPVLETLSKKICLC